MDKKLTFKVLFKNGEERTYTWNYGNEDFKTIENSVIRVKQVFMESYKEGLHAYVEIPNANGGVIVSVNETCGLEIYGIDQLIALIE